MTFVEKLIKRQQEVDSMVCVGLDTDEDLVPASVAWRRELIKLVLMFVPISLILPFMQVLFGPRERQN